MNAGRMECGSEAAAFMDGAELAGIVTQSVIAAAGMRTGRPRSQRRDAAATFRD